MLLSYGFLSKESELTRSTQPDVSTEPLRALADRLKGLHKRIIPFPEWGAATASLLNDCLSFYDTHADSPLRWDAIAIAHAMAHRYYKVRRRAPEGEVTRQRAPTPIPTDPAARRARRMATREEALEYQDLVRMTLAKDPVLNSAEYARVLVIADWALESEPTDLGPSSYADLARVRAIRQQEMDSPATRDLRDYDAPAAAFAGRLAQAERWLRAVEKRLPEAADAHEECASTYFDCLARTAPESEYVAELRRYRRGAVIATAALACDRLKSWKKDAFKQRHGKAPLTAADVALTTSEAGSPEAVYVEFLNKEREIQARHDELDEPLGIPTSELRSVWRNAYCIDTMERVLRAVDRLGAHRLRLRVIAWGVAFAEQFIENTTSWKEDHAYLHSANFQRMLELSRAALDADDLEVGVHADIAYWYLKMLSVKVEQIPEAERASSALVQESVLEAQRRYQDLIQRWPTLFEFKDDGDSFDWYADKKLGMSAEFYFHILKLAGHWQALRGEAARVADGPHPCAAHAARAMLSWLDSGQAKAA